MKQVYLDVSLELDPTALGREADPDRWVLEALRVEADAKCAEAGARLRTDRPPEMIIRRAQRKDTGAAVITVDSRWAVVAPDDVQLRNPGEPL